MKLFTIKNINTNKKPKLEKEFFTHKKEAKAVRNELNGGPDLAENDKGFRVTYGPEHRHFQA